MILKRITENVFCILGGEKGINTGFVIGKNGVLVIDSTFSPDDAKQILKNIRSVTQKPIRYLFNTHHHADHTFGNQVFSARVVAHRGCKNIMTKLLKGEWTQDSIQKWVEENPEWKEKLNNLKITLPDLVFDDRLEIDLGNIKVNLIHVGGHTKDSSIAHVSQSKVLFAGDIVFQGRYPFMRDGDSQKWLLALKGTRDLNFEILVPGHGYICDKAEVEHQIDYFENLLENCKKFIQENLPPDEIVKRKEFIKFARRNVDRHEENIKKVCSELVPAK
jgi:glyoxylase-like metal-dependent hydrolase (beta-lactamase superfamily II)